MKFVTNFRIIDPGFFGKLPWLSYEVVIALLALMSGLTTLFAPDEETLTRFSSLSRPLWTVYVVAVMYIISGFMLIYGLWNIKALKSELAGNIILIGGVLIETIADLIYHSEDFLTANLVFLIVLWGALARVVMVAKGRRMIMVEVED